MGGPGGRPQLPEAARADLSSQPRGLSCCGRRPHRASLGSLQGVRRHNRVCSDTVSPHERTDVHARGRTHGGPPPSAHPGQREGGWELLLSIGEQLGPVGAGGDGDRAVAPGGAHEDEAGHRAGQAEVKVDSPSQGLPGGCRSFRRRAPLRLFKLQTIKMRLPLLQRLRRSSVVRV